MTTQPGYDGDSSQGDAGATHGPDDQPWDPAYTYPLPYHAQFGAPQFGGPHAGDAPFAGPPFGGPPPGGGQFGDPPPEPPTRRPRRRAMLVIGVGALAVATVVGVAVASGTTNSVNGTATASSDGSSGSNTTPGGSTTIPGNGNFPFPTDPFPTDPFPNNGNSGNGNGGSAGTPAATASDAQQVGVVDINTELKYQSAAAAGTGIVLSADGEILTNNHVIDGATSIKVRVVTTGKTYVATVVGTSPTKDIAVLQLQNASGLKTANLGDSKTVSVGDAVVGVGNAGGTGGTPSAASGKVTAIGQTISASDQDGSGSETLHDVIVTDAPIQSGDSGGPLYNAKDEVIGIDTAASNSGASVGFAIPINNALSVAAQIEKGIETSSIHIGYPGFLGVSVTPTQTGGALISGVLPGGPAASAGISAGDVITKVGTTTITDSSQLQQAVSSHDPGSRVSVTYTDQLTGSHSVSVTLATGPAD